MNDRIELAIDLLKDEGSVVVEDLRLEMDGNQKLVVIGWSDYMNFSNLTQKIALSELQDVKDEFSTILQSSLQLKNYVKDKSLQFKLCYDDGGKASIDICAEENGTVKWAVNLPQ